MHNLSPAVSYGPRSWAAVCGVVCQLFACAVFLALSSPVSAQTWSPEQQEIWKFEEKQWQMAKDKDMSWIETMVHPSLSYWETGQPMPQNRASLARWNRYHNSIGTVLELELFPVSIVITGNIAVVHYHYRVASENHKKEHEMVYGRYTDILVKEGERWLFIAWSGGEDPKK